MSTVNASEAFINLNGTVLRSGIPVLTADNRGFRYGDGIFETMLARDGRIRLAAYHFERLINGLRYLQFTIPASFTAEHLAAQVAELCRQNGHALARVRLAAFRGEGGLWDLSGMAPSYLIQSWEVEEGSPGGLEAGGGMTRGAAGAAGVSLDVFEGGRKACDPLSNLKSANYLVYVLASLYAQKRGLSDCLVLNSRDRIADSTIANVFYIKNGRIYTPPLSEGGVAGVMRRHLLEALPGAGWGVAEKETTTRDLETADEIFLTNAVRGIRPVSSFRGIVLDSSLTTIIQKNILATL